MPLLTAAKFCFEILCFWASIRSYEVHPDFLILLILSSRCLLLHGMTLLFFFSFSTNIIIQFLILGAVILNWSNTKHD